MITQDEVESNYGSIFCILGVEKTKFFKWFLKIFELFRLYLNESPLNIV